MPATTGTRLAAASTAMCIHARYSSGSSEKNSPTPPQTNTAPTPLRHRKSTCRPSPSPSSRSSPVKGVGAKANTPRKRCFSSVGVIQTSYSLFSTLRGHGVEEDGDVGFVVVKVGSDAHAQRAQRNDNTLLV